MREGEGGGERERGEEGDVGGWVSFTFFLTCMPSAMLRPPLPARRSTVAARVRVEEGLRKEEEGWKAEARAREPTCVGWFGWVGW